MSNLTPEEKLSMSLDDIIAIKRIEAKSKENFPGRRDSNYSRRRHSNSDMRKQRYQRSRSPISMRHLSRYDSSLKRFNRDNFQLRSFNKQERINVKSVHKYRDLDNYPEEHHLVQPRTQADYSDLYAQEECKRSVHERISWS
ncbi:hypothetical protein GJ496_011896 [Pomphorhynchus laevis]|nr:hypothetical protein GJ496_011896 [Pomphorhynchus laevis]